MMTVAVHRRFWAIFGLSLAAHLGALAWFSLNARAPRSVALPTIMASLRQIVVHRSEATAEPSPAPAPAVARKEARQLPPRREQNLARHAVEAAAPPVQAMPEPVAATTAATGQAREPAVVAHVAPPVGEVPAAPARPQGSLLDAYRQRLTEIFAGQQQYPRIAAQRGWEGEVRLRLRVARKGNLVSVHIDSSSGFEVLDQHALALLDRIANLPPLPDGLEAGEIQVVVPVNYRLRKAT